MALDAGKLESALKSALKSALDAAQGAAPDEGDGHRQKFCNAVAKAVAKEVVDHIVSSMEVTGVQIQVDAGSYLIGCTGGLGSPALPVLNTPLIHSQINDGTGLIK